MAQEFNINRDQLVTLKFKFIGDRTIYDLVEELQLPAGTYLFVGNSSEITMYNSDIRLLDIPYEDCSKITVEKSY